MATTNKSLLQQTYNTSTGNTPPNQVVDPAWIVTPYSNWSYAVNYDFGAIDLALGGSVTITVTGVVTNQAMVLSQYQPMSIIFNGVLSQNLAYTLPSGVGGTWAVYNNTTGAFTLSMTTPAGTTLSATIPSGGPYLVTCNSTSGISIASYVADGSITSAKIAANAVTASKLFGTTGTGNVVLADSAVLTGNPTAPTPAGGDNDFSIATTAFVQGELAPAVKNNVTTTITIGYTVSPANLGTGSGTVTPAASNGNYQYIVNNGAFTIGAPSADCAIDLVVFNGGSPGSISFSGFRTPGTNVSGSTFTATASTIWILSIRRVGGSSFYSWNGPWT